MVYWFTAIIISVEKHSSANAFSSRCVATQQRTFLSPLVSCDTHYAVTSCQGRHSSQFIGQAGHGCHTLSSPPPRLAGHVPLHTLPLHTVSMMSSHALTCSHMLLTGGSHIRGVGSTQCCTSISNVCQDPRERERRFAQSSHKVLMLRWLAASVAVVSSPVCS